MDLTTVRQNPRQVGAKATEVLLALINKEIEPGQKEYLDTELVVRGSVVSI